MPDDAVKTPSLPWAAAAANTRARGLRLLMEAAQRLVDAPKNVIVSRLTDEDELQPLSDRRYRTPV